MNARPILLAGAILAACAFAPAAASAGTVSLVGSKLTHVPSPGQNSTLGVWYENHDQQPDELRVKEDGPGPDLKAGPGCTLAGSAVDCPRSNVKSISLLGGDGDDILYNATSIPATLDGQSGTDTLYSGGGADVLIGGSGTDTANYSYRTTALTVDPDGLADDGAAGEGDLVAPDIESIVGGSGDDNLNGGPGANRLTGGAGADRLNGGNGADTLDGGAGADTIVSRETAADTVTCGSESDTVAADPADSVAPDCESVDVQAASQPPPLSSAPSPLFGGTKFSGKPIIMTPDGRAVVRIACPAGRTRACSGTVTIRESGSGRASASARPDRKSKGKRKGRDKTKGDGKGKVLGTRKFKIAPGQSKKVSVKLSRNGRHRVLRRRRVRCSVNVGVRDHNGRSVVTRRQVTLKAPRRGAGRGRANRR